MTERMDGPRDIDGIIDFFDYMNSLSEEELLKEIHRNSEKYQRLYMSMGGFIAQSCGNLNKLYEMVTSLRLAEKYPFADYHIKHVHGYGSDIIVTNRETKEKIHIEIKTSVVKKGKGYKSSWDFTIPCDLIQNYREAGTKKRKAVSLRAIINNIYVKSSGGIIFEVYHEGTLLKIYHFTGEFIALYCAKKVVSCKKCTMGQKNCSCEMSKKMKVINLGSDRCARSNCGEYHRIKKLLSHDALLQERMANNKELRLDHFTPGEWRDIMAIVPSTCKK